MTENDGKAVRPPETPEVVVSPRIPLADRWLVPPGHVDTVGRCADCLAGPVGVIPGSFRKCRKMTENDGKMTEK